LNENVRKMIYEETTMDREDLLSKGGRDEEGKSLRQGVKEEMNPRE